MFSFISNPVERFFIAPNHMNYHAEHHFFPFVPHGNLPFLRNLVQRCPELNAKIEWKRSYFGHLLAYIEGCKKSRRELDFPPNRAEISSIGAKTTDV